MVATLGLVGGVSWLLCVDMRVDGKVIIRRHTV